MDVTRTLEAWVAPLDGARAALLRLSARTPILRAVVTRRPLRIAVTSSVSVAVAFTLTLVAPVWLYTLGPILLGVPHLAADVRYLVVRRRLGRGVTLVTLGAAAVALALRLTDRAGVLSLGAEGPARVDWLLGAILCAALAWAARARSRATGRAAFVSLVAALLLAAGLAAPTVAQLVLAHAHNLVAVALWCALFGAWRGPRLVPVALALGGAGLLVSGLVGDAVLAGPGAEGLGLSVLALTDVMAPGAEPALALGLTLSFVFLQAVHYGIWLGAIPQEDVRAAGTPTFRMSVRALLRDLGPAGLLVCAVGSGGLAVAALASVHAARDGYLVVASFHGWLELAVAGLLFVRAGAQAPA